MRQAFDVVPGAVTRAGDLALPRGGTLTGRVTDRAGTPLVGVRVRIGLGGPSRAGEGEGIYDVPTGPDGRYTITRVEAQDAYATAYSFSQPYGLTFSGGVSDPGQAVPLSIRSGRTTTFDAVLAPQARLAVDMSGVQVGEFETVTLDVFTDEGVSVGPGNDALGDGRVVLPRLPGTVVKLRATLPDGRVVWWKAGTSLATGTPISLVAGRTNVVAFDVSG